MRAAMADLRQEDGRLSARFGDHSLLLTEGVLSRSPRLRSYEGRKVVLGIRPEDIEDASLASDAREEGHMSVVCDIREDMGSEVYVHFNVAGEAVVSEEVVEAMTIDRPEDEETRLAAERARGSGVSFVARLGRTTRAQERGELVVAVDLERLHFFDPETGLRIDGD